MSTILILEDSPEIKRLLMTVLNKHTLVFSQSVREFEGSLSAVKTVDLFLLDIMLPDGNGLDVCNALKSHVEYAHTPIIFLSAKKEIADIVAGLSLDVEDYITKPFEPLELRARVDLRLKKAAERQATENVFEKNGLIFNIPLQKVTFLKKGKTEEIEMTPFEFRLLLFLIKHEEHVLSREQLMNSVWGENVHVLDRTIDTHMSNLRKKLKGSPFQIKSVYGQGYRLLKAA